MEQNQVNEQEIDLKDLIYAVLKKWRLICIAAVLIGVLLGGYQLVSGRTDAETETEQEAVDEYDTEQALYELNLAATEKQLEAAQKILEAESGRMTDSLLMKLDPAEAVCLTYNLQITVDSQILPGIPSNDPDRIQYIVEGYEAKLSDEFMTEAAAELGVSVSELASVTAVRSDIYTHRIYLDAYAESKEAAAEILNAFTMLIGENQDAMGQALGEHTIAQVGEKLNVEVSQDIADRQLQFISSLNDIKTTVTNLQTAYSDLESTVPEEPASPAQTGLRSVVKYGVLGFVLGGFMMVFFVCVGYLMSDKTRRMDEITRRYGLKALGEFTEDAEESKKFLSGIDRWIDRIFGYGRKLGANETYQLITANVKNYLPEEAKRVLVTGSASEEKIGQIAKHLADTVGSATFEGAPSLSSDYKTLETLPASDAVILVEEKGHSTMGELEAELTIIKNVEKTVVGIILC